MFKIGDIVEAQCLFIVIPTRSGQRTMKIILRAMTMLNSDFSKVSRSDNVIPGLTDACSGSAFSSLEGPRSQPS